MNLKKILWVGSALLGTMGFIGNVFAQTWDIDSVEVLVGTNTVTVPWQLTAGGGLEGVGIDIEFNDALLTPVITESADCFDEVDTILPPGCTVVGNNIRVTTSNLPGTPLVDQSGQIVFEIDAGAEVGDFSLLSLSVASATPGGVSVTLDSGRVDIVDAPPAELDVNPTDIAFGNVRIGETSDEVPVAICNSAEPGSAPLTISGITTSPSQFLEGAGSTCGDPSFDLAPGDCCNYHVTFSPDAEAGFTGSVVIESSAGDETVTLSGQGTVSDANLTITPDSADFGELDINADAVCETFALQNSATEDSLNITEVSLAAAAFSIGADSCSGSGADLAPGGSCSVEVCFDPDSEGTFFDQLVVTSSANDVAADLEGEGTATADLVVTPSFGPVNLGFGLQGDTITANGNIVNNGSADAVVQCDLVDENDPPVFSTTLPLGELVTVEAGADPIPFEVSCALPEDAEDGDTFDGQIQCDVERGGVSDATTHFLTCGVSEFEPLPVPTMSNWSIALFALLMLLVGGISIRFFRT